MKTAKSDKMKRLVLLFLLLGSLGKVLAQQDYDSQFGISFSPVSDPPGTNQPFGFAGYIQNGWDYVNFLPATNVFIVSINLGENPATDGWILQKEDDGSFTPIMELTNEFYDVSSFPSSSDSVGTFPDTNSVGENYYSQGFQLTIDQVQNLIAGKWYAEVDYDGDQYLGNLVLITNSMSSPTAAINVSPATIFSTGIGSFPGIVASALVIAPNNTTPATVIFDGSKSTDPFYLPLQSSWQEGNVVFASTSTTTNKWITGSHQILLKTTDGFNSGAANFTLIVVTPSVAVNKLILMTDNVSSKKKNLFTPLLLQAKSAFDRNNANLGVKQLKIFQNQVRVQLSPTSPLEANDLIKAAQDIIEAVRK